MTLTISQAFQDAFASADPEPVFIVKITTAGGEQIATLGRSDNLTYPESVISVTPVTRSLDILTNAVRTGGVTVEFADDNFFELLWADRLKNQKVEILIGEASIAEVDYEPFFEGIVGAVKYKAGKYIVNAATPVLLADVAGVAGAFVAKHPLQIIDTVFTRSNFESSMYVSADLDPTDAAYASTISHWNCSQGLTWLHFEDAAADNRKRSLEAVEGTDIINDAALLLGGRITEDESGQIRFYQYDSTTAAADSWTDDDLGMFEIVDLHRMLKNRVDMSFADIDGYQGRHIVDDTASQSNFAFPSGNDFVSEHRIDSGMLTSYALIHDSSISASAASFTISGGRLFSFCGLRWPSFEKNSPVAQPASAALSATRLGYIRIDEEIIEIDGFTVDDTWAWPLQYRDPHDNSIVNVTVPIKATVSVSGAGTGRGAKGTSAVAHSKTDSNGDRTIVYDVTIPVAVTEAVIARHANGVPVIAVTTNMSKYDVQVGDFVTITSNRYRAYGKTSLGTSVKWEVIGKEVMVGVGNTEIKWTLAKATDSADPALSEATRIRLAHPTKSQGLRSISEFSSEDIGTNHIVSGMAVTSVSGFIVKIAAGYASNITGRTSNIADVNRTMTASKDTYIAWDCISGQPVEIETALGAGTPTLEPGWVWLAKVVTDGSGVTSITDPGKVTTAIDGSIITASTVDSTQLAASAVTTVKISPTAVTTAKIAASAVTTTEIKTFAVTAGKLGTDSVIETKIADQAVTTRQIGLKAFSAYRSGSTQSITNKTLTKVQFNDEDYDLGSDYDKTTNHRWTAPGDCVAEFNAQVTLDNLSTATYAYLALRVDGATVRQTPRQYNLTGSTLSNFRVNGSFGHVSISSGSYAEVWVYHDETSASRSVNYNSISDTSWFTGKQVRLPSGI